MNIDRTHQEGELNPAIKRFIKRKEKELGRACRSIWSFTNPQGTQHLYGSFCRNYDKLPVTLGAANHSVYGGFEVSK